MLRVTRGRHIPSSERAAAAESILSKISVRPTRRDATQAVFSFPIPHLRPWPQCSGQQSFWHHRGIGRQQTTIAPQPAPLFVARVLPRGSMDGGRPRGRVQSICFFASPQGVAKSSRLNRIVNRVGKVRFAQCHLASIISVSYLPTKIWPPSQYVLKRKAQKVD